MSNFPAKPTLNDAKFWRSIPSQYKTITTTGQVKATDGLLTGIFVSSGTPTITVYDNAAQTGTVLLAPFVSAAATSYLLPEIYFANGCFVSLTNAGTVQVFYK